MQGHPETGSGPASTGGRRTPPARHDGTIINVAGIQLSQALIWANSARNHGIWPGSVSSQNAVEPVADPGQKCSGQPAGIWLRSAFVIYQDPLAYLLGLEGVALLDAWAGDHDRAFTDARLAEIRRLLDDEKLRDRGVFVERTSTVLTYRQLSAGYDAEAGGGLFATDEPVVAEYLSGREPGVALDAACGTGRFSEYLARCGHRVIGVDSSPDMLAYARQRVPDGEFHVGELDRLPLPDDSVDVIVCALALEHVPLEPVLAEFARVLRPGGDLVISDVHHELITRGSAMTSRGPAGEAFIAPTYRHQLGDYLRAALSLGLQVRRCEEPRAVPLASRPPEPATEIGDWQDWPWTLIDYLPSAAQAAGGRPSLVIWHFQLPGG
jgi:SAM-dependent methyltransferase